MSNTSLAGKIALVTGASRGIGKGIALGLAERGATVIITGRTLIEGSAPSKLPGTVQQTADQVNDIGGHGIAMACDHADDSQTLKVFEQIKRDYRRLDILVNNVWAGYEHFTDGTRFWEERGFWDMPLSRWHKQFDCGVRAHFVCSQQAVPIMMENGSGLIVNISFWAAQQSDMGDPAYCAAKAADDAMARSMAHHLSSHNIAVVSLYPGLVRTESVMANAQHFDLSNSESPQFVGRAVGALATDANVMRQSGKILVSAQVALDYEFTDIDGKQPRPFVPGQST
jgi:dehydrogenase/reductase SDR family member 1